MPNIAIIGAGFCGTMTAVHLLRRLALAGTPETKTDPFRIVLIERANRFARGVAYGTQHPLHLLNVPAGKMSALPEEPDHFLRWAQLQDSSVAPYDFLPRRLYGSYISDLLQESIRTAPHVEFQRIDDEAVAIELSSENTASLVFRSSKTLTADRIVLAPGNYPPADLPIPGASDFYSTNAYIRDPWAGDMLAGIDPAQNILLIGTGLTMVDVVVQLHAQGHTGRIHAVSRHGLLPRPHSNTPVPPAPPLPPNSASPLNVLRAVRQCIREHATDYRSAVDALRPKTCHIWQSWSDDRRRQFLRHARAFWEVHRHRIAPQIGKTIAALLAAERVNVSAGRILSFTSTRGRVEVAIRQRGSDTRKTISVDNVINCTGPDTDIRRSSEPLLKNLLQQNLIRPDPLGLGLDTQADGAVISADGQPSRFLFTLGSTCKGRLWECTAVPELRDHAANLARTLLPDSVLRAGSSRGT